MTVNRNFKAEVRRRMAQTGERYSTARLHLLNAQPHLGADAQPDDDARAAGEPILPGYPLEPDVGEHDAALHARVLAHAGLTDPDSGAPLTGAMLNGLGGGIGFMFATFDYSGLVTTTLVIRYHPGPYHQNMRDRAGAHSSVSTTTSAAKAARALDEALEAGRPAVCTVGRGALPWHGSSNPLEEAAEHLVAIIGRDGDDLLVDDFGVARRITADDLAAARAAVRKAKHHLVTVKPGRPINLGAAIRAAVADTHELLTSGNAPDGIPTSWAKKFGITGMANLAGLMRDNRKAGWAQLFADPANLFTALVRIHECLEVQFSSHGAGRLLYGEFCLEAAERMENVELARAGEAYLETGQAWAELADAALPDTDSDLNRARELCVAHQSALVAGDDPRAADAALDELRRKFVSADAWNFDDRLAHFTTLADQLDAIAARETIAAAHLQAFLDRG